MTKQNVCQETKEKLRSMPWWQGKQASSIRNWMTPGSSSKKGVLSAWGCRFFITLLSPVLWYASKEEEFQLELSWSKHGELLSGLVNSVEGPLMTVTAVPGCWENTDFHWASLIKCKNRSLLGSSALPICLPGSQSLPILGIWTPLKVFTCSMILWTAA